LYNVVKEYGGYEYEVPFYYVHNTFSQHMLSFFAAVSWKR